MAARGIEGVDDAWENGIIMIPIKIRGQAMIRGKPRGTLHSLFYSLYKDRFRLICFSPSPFCIFFPFVIVLSNSSKMDAINPFPSQSLTLTPDENTVYTLTDVPNESTDTISLLLKLLTVKHYNRPSLIKTLSPVWTSQCRFPVVISEHSDGLFLSLTIFAAPDASFPITPDQLHYVPFWVQVYGIPFRCKSLDLAKIIASGVGDLIQVDHTTVKEGTGPYLRIRLLIDVNKPIRRGIHVRFFKMGREFVKWLDFKYERLPDYCLYCGMLDHTKKYCHAYLQKCDESISPPPCPYDLPLRGKEKPAERQSPFQYPHPPAITITDMDLAGFPQGSQFPNPFLNYPFSFTPLLNSNVASVASLTGTCQSYNVMIPTPVNPNLSLGFSLSGSSLSAPLHTDSIIVNDSLSFTNPELNSAARSLAEALPSLILNSNQAPAASVVETSLPDSQVRGKGLACASGVKRPTFQACQTTVGGSLRSMLKRARAGDADVSGFSSIPDAEQAGGAEHTRPEK
uniref:Zinc knuckle CX2CX4HX4C domain-containing protein n=1 Tax=Cannabis sativa TaxID=3483 RepID=A0A803NK24_CANSA